MHCQTRAARLAIAALSVSACIAVGCAGRCPSGSGQAPAEPQPAESPHNADADTHGSMSAAEPPTVLDLSAERIDGRVEPLSRYAGKVVLVVNVASECGLTPQYAALQQLYESRHAAGLEVLGFPSNDFGGQEPGTNDQILTFCTQEYGVTFPMFAKVRVVGDDAHPLFARLARVGGPPSWNFTKYVIDRQGRVVARFDPRTRPDDPELMAQIDRLLAGG